MLEIPGDGDVGEVALIILRIRTAQKNFASHGSVRIAIQVEAEHWVLNRDIKTKERVSRNLIFLPRVRRILSAHYKVAPLLQGLQYQGLQPIQHLFHDPHGSSLFPSSRGVT